MSIRKGTEVSWSWGNGTGTGRVVEIHPEKVTRTLGGSEITRNGSDDGFLPVELMLNRSFALGALGVAGVDPSQRVGTYVEPQEWNALIADPDVLLARAALREPSWPLRAAAELGLTWHDAPYPAAYTRGKWDDVQAA